MTNAVYKTQAKRLAEHLSRVHGVKLKPASMLEAVASLHGRPDWNTLLACGPAEATGPITLPEKPTSLPSKAEAPSVPAATYERWVRQAVNLRASSMWIQPSTAGCTVLIRVDGRRRPMLSATRAEYEAVRASFHTIAQAPEGHTKRFANFEGNGDLAGYKFNLALSQYSSANPSDDYITLTWRPAHVQYPDLDKLGLSSLTEWRHGIAQTSGLCLVTGVTNSGKTTTIAATAKALVKEGRVVHVMTSEIADSGVPGASFERGVREHGDVIILGELRDRDALEDAFLFAAHGMLVIAEVHGRDLPGAIERLRAMGASDSRLDSYLNVVITQRLVAKVCPVCRTADGKSSPAGCKSCHEGYHGTIALSEALAAYPGRKFTSNFGSKTGWTSNFRDAAVAAVRDKLTTQEELERVFGPDVHYWLKALT